MNNTKRDRANPLRTLLLIDFMSLAYRMFYKMPPLTTKSGVASAVCYGLLNSLQKLFNQFQPDKVLLSFDSNKSKRRELNCTYKALRRAQAKDDPQREFFYQQVHDIHRRFPSVGIPCVWSEGLESDDVIAILLEKEQYEQAVVVSSDNDLYQLVNDRVHLWDLRLKKLITPKIIEDMFGFPHPLLIAVYKALAGCPSDGVVGLKGWGEKTAKKFMKKCNYNMSLMVRELKTMGKLKEFDNAILLVSLPLGLDYSSPLTVEGEWGINRKELAKVLFDYDIRSINPQQFFHKKNL